MTGRPAAITKQILKQSSQTGRWADNPPVTGRKSIISDFLGQCTEFTVTVSLVVGATPWTGRVISAELGTQKRNHPPKNPTLDLFLSLFVRLNRIIAAPESRCRRASTSVSRDNEPRGLVFPSRLTPSSHYVRPSHGVVFFGFYPCPLVCACECAWERTGSWVLCQRGVHSKGVSTL